MMMRVLLFLCLISRSAARSGVLATTQGTCKEFCGTTVPLSDVPWFGEPISQCDWVGYCDGCPACPTSAPVIQPTSPPTSPPTSAPVTPPTEPPTSDEDRCDSFCGTTVPLSDVPWNGSAISQCDWVPYCSGCGACSTPAPVIPPTSAPTSHPTPTSIGEGCGQFCYENAFIPWITTGATVGKCDWKPWCSSCPECD